MFVYKHLSPYSVEISFFMVMHILLLEKLLLEVGKNDAMFTLFRSLNRRTIKSIHLYLTMSNKIVETK